MDSNTTAANPAASTVTRRFLLGGMAAFSATGAAAAAVRPNVPEDRIADAIRMIEAEFALAWPGCRITVQNRALRPQRYVHGGWVNGEAYGHAVMAYVSTEPWGEELPGIMVNRVWEARP